MLLNINYFSNTILQSSKSRTVAFLLLIVIILISIFLPSIIGSITVIVFVIFSFTGQFKSKKHLFLPIGIYFIMILSLFFTKDYNLTITGLQKESLFLFIPLAFFFLPKFDQKSINIINRWFGLSTVVFALCFFLRAIYRFSKTGNKGVFLFHDLVTLDLNAIYIASFCSLAMFYFIILKNKKTIDFLSLYILVIFIVLLNSKTVFFLDLVLLVWYYMFYSKTSLGVKTITIFFVATFLLLSVFFSEQIQSRLKEEYQTAFVDNTIYKNSNPNQKAYNVSLQQAWNDRVFNVSSFFPGTAYRVFQARIFFEIIHENKLFYTGLGLNASDVAIQKKHQQYKLFKEYNYHNFHNQYIQFFAELGIFGFLILVIMVIYNLINAIRNQDFLHIVFAVTMIILFLTESILCRQRGIVYFVTLFCLFNSVHSKKGKSNLEILKGV